MSFEASRMGAGLTDEVGGTKGVTRAKALRRAGGEGSYAEEALTVEEPLEIALRWRGELHPFGVTFRTPGDDVSLCVGLLFGEGHLDRSNQIVSIKVVQEEEATMPATRATVTVSDQVELDLERMRRAFPISAACGACGKSALAALRIDRQGRFDDRQGPRLGESALTALPEKLRSEQTDFARTGGLHAAARFGSGGVLLDLAEDVGRHNAMDKLVGRSLAAGMASWDGQGVVFSGRVGYDLMQKVLRIGSCFVASIGAPSSLAVELATLFNVTLVGFLRGDRFNVYSAPQRIQFS